MWTRTEWTPIREAGDEGQSRILEARSRVGLLRDRKMTAGVGRSQTQKLKGPITC